MSENDIKIINTSIHKKLTENHLAQINFTAILPKQLWDMYIEKTSFEKPALNRIRFMEPCDNFDHIESLDVKTSIGTIRVFGRVSHGYGYDISQDIYNAIMDSKGVK